MLKKGKNVHSLQRTARNATINNAAGSAHGDPSDLPRWLTFAQLAAKQHTHTHTATVAEKAVNETKYKLQMFF